jgi:hypothetical protein
MIRSDDGKGGPPCPMLGIVLFDRVIFHLATIIA